MRKYWEMFLTLVGAVATMGIVLLCDPAQAKPGTTISLMPQDSFCTVNPPPLATVVCDYHADDIPKRGQVGLRVRVTMRLTVGGRLKCRTWDLYDPTIGSIRDGRIVATQTECYR